MDSTDLNRTLAAKTARLAIFADLAPEIREAICAQLEWMSLPGGWTLFEEGEPGDAMFIVLSGRLGVIASTPGSGEQVMARISAGETVGEMALLSDEPRSARVEALRDTELLRMPRAAFDRLIDASPRAMRFMNGLLVSRLRNTSRRPASDDAPRALAIQPLSSNIDAASIARDLARALEALGRKTAVVTAADAARGTEWFARLEEAHDLVLYVGECATTEWTGRCLRQTDRMLALVGAAATEVTGDSAGVEALITARPHGGVELVIVHPRDALSAAHSGEIFGRLPAAHRWHLRAANASDLARLARLIAGRAVGIVLSGGGARGFAHLGVLAALKEAGIEIDLYAGASMGAIIAATAALEWDQGQALEHLIPAFVTSNPLGDYTIPVIALARGRRVSRRLREHFGDLNVEECWRMLLCTSSDLTSGQVWVHRTGPIWKALRASVAIPGVLTPVIEGNHILVDGGVLNNMPIDLMLGMRRGPVIAVDVMREHTVTADAGILEEQSLFTMLRPARRGSPNIITLLMRAGTVGSEAQIRHLRPHVDLLIEPRIESIGMLDWKAYRLAIDAGYRQTMAILEHLDKSSLFN
ncbi:MAG TPA: patatin-like phospholipase family protein [Candidatus Binataceae bacterium]|nr:patatin-like phospholipase family protein [Candidatus Binataceae bacterium]